MKKYNQTEIVTLKGTTNKFLVISNANNTLATMVMLGQIDVYWLDCWGSGEAKGLSKVTNPQTIFGASPNCFGIKIE